MCVCVTAVVCLHVHVYVQYVLAVVSHAMKSISYMYIVHTHTQTHTRCTMKVYYESDVGVTEFGFIINTTIVVVVSFHLAVETLHWVCITWLRNHHVYMYMYMYVMYMYCKLIMLVPTLYSVFGSLTYWRRFILAFQK